VENFAKFRRPVCNIPQLMRQNRANSVLFVVSFILLKTLLFKGAAGKWHCAELC